MQYIYFLNCSGNITSCCTSPELSYIMSSVRNIYSLIQIIAPILFKNIGPKCVQGPCPEGKMTCGEIVKIREKFKNL